MILNDWFNHSFNCEATLRPVSRLASSRAPACRAIRVDALSVWMRPRAYSSAFGPRYLSRRRMLQAVRIPHQAQAWLRRYRFILTAVPQVSIAHQRRRWFLLVSRNSQPHDLVLAQRRSCDTEGSLIKSNASSAMRLSGSHALLASSRQCICPSRPSDRLAQARCSH